MKLNRWRRGFLFGACVLVLVFGAFAGPTVLAMADSVSFTPGEGSGPNWCGSYGGTNQASFDNVYACSPNNPSAGATPFDPYAGFQCVELANRFLWDAHSDGPIFGRNLNGWNFAQTVHADYSSVPLDSNGTAGDPYLPGDIVSFTGNPGTLLAGVGHVAIVTSSTESSSGNGSVTVLQENATPYLQTLAVSNWSLRMPSGSEVTPYQFDAFTSSPPPSAPPVIAVRTRAGEVFAKQGNLSAQWVDEAGPNVTAVAVASDPVHGPLIAIRESKGEVYAKEGGLSAQWVDEAGPTATVVAVASDPEYGPLIAVRYSSGGVFAKEGGLSAQWVDEAGGDSGVAVAG